MHLFESSHCTRRAIPRSRKRIAGMCPALRFTWQMAAISLDIAADEIAALVRDFMNTQN